ncbi:MAG TPA: aminoglycoside phosphotransferase family protein [Mesorhizobium sp.]|uniref:phosphotransferase family protein n=1 Tax=Mesorhizobium sp. TaxID=1871066 RepID=UPI002DDD8B4C|nr:aminoglycoside phosphotransferase family protein [Mesorhizobium sp.]HEV2502435.1 aminoglycoside phosphotransferase family protein [Mesorhizobium sp.]
MSRAHDVPIADRPTPAEIAAALKLPPSPKVVPTGQNNLVLDFGETIVRQPYYPSGVRELTREANVLAALRPHLPPLVPVLELRDVDGHVVSVHRKLAGEPITDPGMLPLEERKAFARDLAAFLVALHALPEALLPDVEDVDPSAEWHDLLRQCEDHAFPLLPADVVKDLRQRFRAFLDEPVTPDPAIIHGDFGAGNILADDGRLTGVIDFAGCGIGDPAYDFASLAAGFGDDFLALVALHTPISVAMRERMAFYRCTFPLLDVLFGVEQGDDAALQAGLRKFDRPGRRIASPRSVIPVSSGHR